MQAQRLAWAWGAGLELRSCPRPSPRRSRQRPRPLSLVSPQRGGRSGGSSPCLDGLNGAAVGPASDSEAAGGTISALQATVDQILSCVQQLHGLVLVEFKWGRHGEDDEQTVKKATKFLRSIAPGGCCITPHIRPLILRRTRLSASCSIISERTNRGSGSLRCKELQRIFQDRRR
ncbi:hypothetical protein Vretimale_3045 [Volvox reticuliferus]|uniref:Uncharacterized protein n=1 Tax=Volvox reticuliferus TaxID=1737510 RepID=A0A8J4D813_9CHLO|nr:hypothetical protein Vretimale_3045 [Volvox reticuliferus]